MLKKMIFLLIIIIFSGCIEGMPDLNITPDLNMIADLNVPGDLNLSIPDLNQTIVEELPEDYCELAEDCKQKNIMHIMCVGEWTCLDNHCAWNCETTDIEQKEEIDETPKKISISEKKEIDKGEEILGLKGMRNYAGQDLKIIVGEGITKENGDYAIQLNLYDMEGNLIDSRYFREGDDESLFVNEDSDRIVKNEFLVQNIYKRMSPTGERYLVKII